MKPTWEQGDVKLYLGDCLEVLPELEAGSVDAVVTDPPYGIGYKSGWKTSITGGPRLNDAAFGEDVINLDWIPMTYELQKDYTLLYCFLRWDVMNIWKDAFVNAGYKSSGRLIWNKSHWKMGDLRFYGSQVEDILLMRKNDAVIFPGGKGRRGNMFTSSSSYVPEGQYNHPTQKPEEVLRIFVTDATKPDCVVLDPFMGSGTTGVACVQTGRKFIGIEIEPKYFEIAVRRISEAQLQIRMPL